MKHYTNRPWVGLAIATTLLASGGTAYAGHTNPFKNFKFPFHSENPPQTIPLTSIAKPTTVTSLGRLEPSSEVIRLSAPTSAEGSRVEQLLVKEGDRVKAGQVIAILDSRDRLQAALEEAQEQVRVKQANLARVKAGAQTGQLAAQQAAIARIEAERRNDIEAQAATVARLHAQMENAEAEYQRYHMLSQEGAISASVRDSKWLAFETARRQLQEAQANLERIRLAQQQQLNEAKATLAQIAEVRPVNMEVSAAEVRAAQSAVKRVQANLAQAYVKAPQEGQVLKVLTRAGELVSSNGIVELGETRQMYAVAEVYESDISKIQLGQMARMMSSSLPEELRGTVERIGLRVLRQEVVNTDPAANTDARVVEVRVRLNDVSSLKVVRLTNLQVKVVIDL